MSSPEPIDAESSGGQKLTYLKGTELFRDFTRAQLELTVGRANWGGACGRYRVGAECKSKCGRSTHRERRLVRPSMGRAVRARQVVAEPNRRARRAIV